MTVLLEPRYVEVAMFERADSIPPTHSLRMADPITRLNSAPSDRQRVERELGEGVERLEGELRGR